MLRWLKANSSAAMRDASSESLLHPHVRSFSQDATTPVEIEKVKIAGKIRCDLMCELLQAQNVLESTCQTKALYQALASIPESATQGLWHEWRDSALECLGMSRKKIQQPSYPSDASHQMAYSMLSARYGAASGSLSWTPQWNYGIPPAIEKAKT